MAQAKSDSHEGRDCQGNPPGREAETLGLEASPDLELDMDLVSAEWGACSVNGVYLNSGSCGVKPRAVLDALQNGLEGLNHNPTIQTFIDGEIWTRARALAAALFGVPAADLMLTQNSTFGIQLVMQSLLLAPGDEFVCTDQEHGSVNTLCRFLEESRGIVVRRHIVDAHAGSEAFCRGILGLVSDRTRLVLASEINCLTGWRPQLYSLRKALAAEKIPLLVDGAHAPGQGPVQIRDYPFWVASAHKWMGAPNGCGFLYVSPTYKELLRPLTVGDRFYNEDFGAMHRFEWPGTCDIVRLFGLVAALELQMRLGPEKIKARQRLLHSYLRAAISEELPSGTIRTPWTDGETSGLFSVFWRKEQLLVGDLREALYNKHRIWTQPDFALPAPGLGMRISCHISNSEEEINLLVRALKPLFAKGG